MDEIFKHVDHVGVILRVDDVEGAVLRVRRPHDAVRLDREAVKALWLALGEWLHPDAAEAPLPYASQSLIERMVARAVKDQVSAVLPLHLAPVARVTQPGCVCEIPASGHFDDCPVSPRNQPDPEPHDVGHAYVPEPDAEEGWQRVDPEPHDVGHADEPVRRTAFVPDPHFAPGARNYLGQVLGVVPEPAAGHPTEDEWAKAPGRRVANDGVPLPYCKESAGGCGHSWGQHTGGECKARSFDGRGHVKCECTQTEGDRANVVLCICDHPRHPGKVCTECKGSRRCGA